jgi:O-antigen/teichoic acid export membrane protein
MLKGGARPRSDASGNPDKSASAPAEGPDGGRGTVARNAIYLMLGQVATTALAILFSAALARNLGAGDFGLYFLVVSFSTFAYVLADWGHQLYIIRDVASQPERGSVLLGTALVFRIISATIVTVPSGLAAWALGYDAITCWYAVIFIGASLPLFLSQSYGMVFRGRDRMDLEAWISVANKVALLALTLAALALGSGLPGVFVAQALAGIVALAIASRLYSRVTSGPLRWSPEVARQMLLGGGALVTLLVMNNIQPYIDAVILSRLAPADVVGWYGAAKNVMGTMLAPAGILGAASFPRLSRAAANGGPFKAEVRAALRPIFWLGALASVGTYLFADDAITILYGQQHFAPSGIILKVYAPGFFLLFANILLGYSLFSLGRAKAFSVVKAASVVVSTALDLVLIPILQERTGNGGIGVVAAFVASEFVVSAGAVFLLWRKGLGLDVAVDMIRALGSAALTLFLFYWMPPLPFYFGIPICIIAFSLCSAGLGLIKRSDIDVLRALLRKERSTPKASTAA